MKMVSTKSESIIVTIFYDMKGQHSLPNDGTKTKLNKLLTTIEEEFIIQCLDIYNSISNKILSVAHSLEVC
jgi:hypothetical protein